MMRLQKYLALSGVASRRNSEKLIADGHVAVNGHVVTEMGVQVDETCDKITVDGVLPYQELADIRFEYGNDWQMLRIPTSIYLTKGSHILRMESTTGAMAEYIKMLQDMILAAVNEAMRTADTEAANNMSRLTGGMNLGGLF